MFTDEKCPICGGTVTVELDAASTMGSYLIFQCSGCQEATIYDITPEVEEFTDDFMEYLAERVKEIEASD